jgi:hypothetical protein
LGSYLVILWGVLQEFDVPLTINLLLKVWNFMLYEDRRLLNLSLLFSLIGVIPYSLFYWSSYKASLNRLFKPKIEIVEELSV